MSNPVEKDRFYQAVGERIREVREEQNLSRAQVALDAKLSESTIDHAEKGLTISLLALTKMAEALDVTLDELVPLGALR